MSTTVIHAYPKWLPLTQSWMFHQFHNLPEDCEKHVVCATSQNLDQYMIDNLHVLHPQKANFNYKAVKYLLTKLGIRDYQKFLYKKIVRLNANLIHSHFGPVAVANMYTVARTNAKHAVTFYGADVLQKIQEDPNYIQKYAKLFDLIDLVLCEGPFMRNTIIEKLGCPSDKIHVHKLGVDLTAIPYKPRHWDGSGPLKILIAGTFREKKGIPDALMALSGIAAKVPIEITIYGDATNKPGDQEEKEKILRIIKENNLEPITKMLGFRPYSELLSDAYNYHIFLSPSITAKSGDNEGGTPVTIIEMAASGMPVVSTTHCDIPEVIVNNKTGWLSPEGDIGDLTKNLAWLANNPEKWRPYLNSGRSHLEENYDAVRQGDHLYSLYKKVK